MEEEQEKQVKIKESKLEGNIQQLLNLICDIRLMEENVMELEYDATKTPLGMIYPLNRCFTSFHFIVS